MILGLTSGSLLQRKHREAVRTFKKKINEMSNNEKEIEKNASDESLSSSTLKSGVHVETCAEAQVEAKNPSFVGTQLLSLTPSEKKKLKKQRQRERRNLEKTMASFSLAEEDGRNEEKARGAGPSGFDSSKAGNRQSKVESVSSATLKAASKKPGKMANKGFLLRVQARDYTRKITPADASYITESVEDKMLEDTAGIYPQVEKSTLSMKGFCIICKDQDTLEWIKTTVNNLPPPPTIEGHPGYIAVGPGDRPPPKKFFVWFPGDQDPNKSMELLSTCYEDLILSQFHVWAVIPGSGGKTAVIGVEQEMVNWLSQRSFKIRCGISTIKFKESGKRQQSVTEKPPHPSAEQGAELVPDAGNVSEPPLKRSLIEEQEMQLETDRDEVASDLSLDPRI